VGSKFDDAGDDGFPPGSTTERPKAPVVAEIRPAAARALNWPDLSTREPPARRWAINGWLGYGHTTLLVGSGGIGKTLIAQQIGSALALGERFVDDIPCALKVLMWACEDDHDELWRRQTQIARHHQVALDAFADNFVLVPRQGQDNALVSTEYGKIQFTGMERHLAEQVNDYKADVVILDNVAQLYGAGENDRHAVTVFLNTLTGILGHRALLLLAHPSRSAGSEFSGSGAWENVARTRLYLGHKLPDEKDATASGDAADQYRYLARRKANYSSRDWRRFTYQEGVLVAEDAALVQGGVVGEIRARQAERIVVEGLKKLGAMGLIAREGQKSDGYLPRMLVEYKLAEGRTKSELATAMRDLMTSGRIIKAKLGRNDRREPIFGLTASDTPLEA
jgi:hypothetical protein